MLWKVLIFRTGRDMLCWRSYAGQGSIMSFCIGNDRQGELCRGKFDMSVWQRNVEMVMCWALFDMSFCRVEA
jgi:hypothetical protein